MQGIHKELSIGSVACINVRSQAPKIVGNPRRSEKNIASVFFNFKYRAVLRVIPDLDTPGNNARAWANPMKGLIYFYHPLLVCQQNTTHLQ